MSNEYRPWDFRREEKDIDSFRSRDCMKMLHLLVRAGAHWEPDGRAIGETRRSLLKMRANYTMEFLWILSEYRSCSQETGGQLMAKPTLRNLVSGRDRRLGEIMASFGQKVFHPNQ
jgi:hypothetical protein